MSETTEPDSAVASHTLAYLRRIDRRQNELSELVLREQELIGRLDRHMSEGFSAVQRDMDIVKRDIGELRSDMVLMENRVLTAVAADHFANAQLDDHGDRLDALERSLRPAS